MDHYQNFFIQFYQLLVSREIRFCLVDVTMFLQNTKNIYSQEFFYPLPPIFPLLLCDIIEFISNVELDSFIQQFIIPFEAHYINKINIFHDLYKRNSIDLHEFFDEIHYNGNIKFNEVNVFSKLKIFFTNHQQHLQHHIFYQEFIFRIFLSKDNYSTLDVLKINLTQYEKFQIAQVEHCIPFSLSLQELPQFIKECCHMTYNEFENDMYSFDDIQNFQEDYIFSQKICKIQNISNNQYFFKNTIRLDIISSKLNNINSLFEKHKIVQSIDTKSKLSLQKRLALLLTKTQTTQDQLMSPDYSKIDVRLTCDYCHQDILHNIFCPVLINSEISNFLHKNIPLTCGHNFHYQCIKNKYNCPFCDMEMHSIIIQNSFNFYEGLFDKFPLLLRFSYSLLNNVFLAYQAFKPHITSINDGGIISRNLLTVLQYMQCISGESPITYPIQQIKLSLPKDSFSIINTCCIECNTIINIEEIIFCIFCGSGAHTTCRNDCCNYCQQYLIFHPMSMRIIDHEGQCAIRAPYRNFFGEIPNEFYGRRFVIDPKIYDKLMIYGLLGYWQVRNFGMNVKFQVVLEQYVNSISSISHTITSSFEDAEVNEI
eukprot:EST41959.1 Hypothetical protein SS50377_18264 [Spironucleus salmonicida]